MKTAIFFACSLLAAILAGCAAPPRTSVYAPANEEGISTGGVDSHDYQLVVETMVSSMLKNGLQAEGGQKPVIALGAIFNRTPYNVETRMLSELIRVEILKSGLARFSTATDVEHKGGESGDLYKQLKFQNESGYVDPSTVKRYGQLTGTDYILFGNIYSIERRSGGMTEANFTFNLTMTEVRTGLAVWADTKPIRKNLK
jgi:hypothetical protein